MTGRHDHWQGVYGTKVETEVSWFQERPEASIRLIEAAGFGRAGRVIDVGGGASRLVDALLDLGFSQITVLDIAEAALAKARRRLGERAAAVQWLVADVTGWTAPARYDVWHDRAVFHFLTDADDRAAYAAAMAAAVPAGGQAIVATFASAGPERCSGLPVCRYDADGLAAQFAPHFRPVEALTEDHLTPAGKMQKFQYCRMERL